MTLFLVFKTSCAPHGNGTFFAKILKMKYGRWQKNLSFSAAAEQIAHFTFHAKRH